MGNRILHKDFSQGYLLRPKTIRNEKKMKVILKLPTAAAINFIGGQCPLVSLDVGE